MLEYSQKGVVCVQTKPLCDVATIITGVTEGGEQTDSVRYFCFQPNSFNELGEVSPLPTILRKDPVKDEQLVGVGDVLVKRLNHNFPFLVQETMPETVVSPNLFIVRPGPEIDSAYLAFLLGQEGALMQIQHLSGSSSGIKAISTKKLMEVTVPIVPMEKQKALGNLWQLTRQRKRLLNEYATESDRQLSAAADQILK